MSDETLEPFNWWWSGKFWYCHIQNRSGRRVSGAGLTKPQAVADAKKELRKRQHV